MAKTSSGFTVIERPLVDENQIKRLREFVKNGDQEGLDDYIDQIVSGSSEPPKNKNESIDQIKVRLQNLTNTKRVK